MITSIHNPKLQALRRLHRRRERDRCGRFLAEGEDLIHAAELAGREPLEGYRVRGCEIGGDRFVEVEASALASVSTLGSGTRAIAVYEQRCVPAPIGPLCLYLHGVSDPGNVGACLRSAHAFGASCVALGAHCADPCSPKAVRASMGAIFAVPLARVSSVAELPGSTVALAAREGMRLSELAAILRARRASLGGGSGAAVADAGDESAGEAVTLLIGAERQGLPAEVIESCDEVAHIPISSESLNAAMAATVALYELTRDSNRVRAS